MVTTKIMDKKAYKKPIIMPTNPARGQMPYALAVADDLAAIEKAKKLEAFEASLEAENKDKLQAMSDEMIKAKAPKEEVKVEPPKADEPQAPSPKVDNLAKARAVKAATKKNPFNK